MDQQSQSTKAGTNQKKKQQEIARRMSNRAVIYRRLFLLDEPGVVSELRFRVAGGAAFPAGRPRRLRLGKHIIISRRRGLCCRIVVANFPSLGSAMCWFRRSILPPTSWSREPCLIGRRFFISKIKRQIFDRRGVRILASE